MGSLRSKLESHIGCSKPCRSLVIVTLSPILSGAESAILNRESGHSESCDSMLSVLREGGLCLGLAIVN